MSDGFRGGETLRSILLELMKAFLKRSPGRPLEMSAVEIQRKMVKNDEMPKAKFILLLSCSYDSFTLPIDILVLFMLY